MPNAFASLSWIVRARGRDDSLDSTEGLFLTLKRTLVNSTLRFVANMICRVDDEQLAKVPDHGPLILVANHVNFLEVPIVFLHLQPRPVTGYVKASNWRNPFFRFLFDLWEGIPLQRGEAHMSAFRRGLTALAKGQILAVAPEGTRSGDGRLQEALPGVVVTALHSGAPLLPLVYYGAEHYRENLLRLRRTPFRIVVGDPFFLHTNGLPVTREIRRRMTDEIMYQLAALLPPQYRGVYSNLDEATEEFLRFAPPAESNLRRAQAPSGLSA